MSKITGNEPINATIWDERNKPEIIRDNDGLTIRQHFAALALGALLSTTVHDNFAPNLENIGYCAAMAVTAADALIAELNKQP